MRGSSRLLQNFDFTLPDFPALPSGISSSISTSTPPSFATLFSPTIPSFDFTGIAGITDPYSPIGVAVNNPIFNAPTSATGSAGAVSNPLAGLGGGGGGGGGTAGTGAPNNAAILNYLYYGSPLPSSYYGAVNPYAAYNVISAATLPSKPTQIVGSSVSSGTAQGTSGVIGTPTSSTQATSEQSTGDQSNPQMEVP